MMSPQEDLDHTAQPDKVSEAKPLQTSFADMIAQLRVELSRLRQVGTREINAYRGMFGVDPRKIVRALALGDDALPLLRANCIRKNDSQFEGDELAALKHCLSETSKIADQVLANPIEWSKQATNDTRFFRPHSTREEGQGILLASSSYGYQTGLSYALTHGLDWKGSYSNAVSPERDLPYEEQSIAVFRVNNDFGFWYQGDFGEEIFPACILNSQIQKVTLGFGLEQVDEYNSKANYYLTLKKSNDYTLEILDLETDEGKPVGEIVVDQTGKISLIHSELFEIELKELFGFS